MSRFAIVAYTPKPGKEQLVALVAVRRLGKQDAERRWELLD